MTDRQQKFVAEYVNCLNGTRAAIAAGYSAKTARVQAARLLTKADVSAAVEAAQKKALDDAQVTVTRVIGEYAAIAFLAPRDLFGRSGRLLPIAEIPEGPRRALAAFETEEAALGEDTPVPRTGATKRVRFLSKLAALHALAKHLGMFAERSDSGSYGLIVHLCQDSEEHDMARQPRDRGR